MQSFGDGQACDQFLHAGGAVSLHLVTDMDIGFQCERRRVVSEICLHGFNIVTVFQRDRRKGMTKGMERVVAHAAVPQHTLEVFVHRAAIEGSAKVVGENKVKLVVP